MKDTMKPKAQKPSAKSGADAATAAGAKRKTPASLKLSTFSPKAQGDTPKRLRLMPSSPPVPQGSTLITPTSAPSTPAMPQIQVNSYPADTSNLSARKQRTIHDPLNVTIYDLRQQGLDWTIIADQTNAKCNITGTSLELSGNGCYGRFIRNGPLIARERGEEFKKERYLHMRGPIAFPAGEEQAEVNAGEETELDEETVEGEVLDVIAQMRTDFCVKVAAKVNENLGGDFVTVEEVVAINDRAEDGEL